MKKIIGYVLFVILLIFTMPMVFTNNFKTEEVGSEEVEEKIYPKADYGDFNTIKLLHAR